MPVFVHLASERDVASIRRAGINPRRRRVRASGVYAMPVTRNFYVAHQWLRELKRAGGGTIVGVYFRIPDDEPVLIGHYDSEQVEMTAAEAAGVMFAVEKHDPAAARAADEQARAKSRRRRRGSKPTAKSLPTSPEGFQVIVPRAIERAELIRIKALPQVVGWRYRPGSHGTPPCLCVCCERGRYGVRRQVERIIADEEAGKPVKATLFGRDMLRGTPRPVP